MHGRVSKWHRSVVMKFDGGTHHFDVFELVVRIWDFVLLYSDTGHITPVVSAIWNRVRRGGAIEDKAIYSRAIDHRFKTVDFGLSWAVPGDVHCFRAG